MDPSRAAPNSVDKSSAALNSAGKNSVDKNSVDKNSAGKNSVGKNSAEKPMLPNQNYYSQAAAWHHNGAPYIWYSMAFGILAP